MPGLWIGLIAGFGLALALVVVVALLRGRMVVRFGPDGPVPVDGLAPSVHRSSMKVHQHPDGRVVVERDGQTHEYARLDDVPNDVRQLIDRARQMGPGSHVSTDRLWQRQTPE